MKVHCLQAVLTTVHGHRAGKGACNANSHCVPGSTGAKACMCDQGFVDSDPVSALLSCVRFPCMDQEYYDTFRVPAAGCVTCPPGHEVTRNLSACVSCTPLCLRNPRVFYAPKNARRFVFRVCANLLFLTACGNNSRRKSFSGQSRSFYGTHQGQGLSGSW